MGHLQLDPARAFGAEVLFGGGVQLASQYHQLRIGGDLAALTGIAKCVIGADALDHAFIASHTPPSVSKCADRPTKSASSAKAREVIAVKPDAG